MLCCVVVYCLFKIYCIIHDHVFPFREQGECAILGTQKFKLFVCAIAGLPWAPLQQKHPKKIIIIGGGLSGVMALKQTIAEGHSPILFEARKDVGGLWRYDLDEAPTVYQSTHIDTSRDLNSFGDSPVSSQKPATLSNAEVSAYLRDQVQRFALMQYVRLNTFVRKVEPIEDQNASRRVRWRVRRLWLVLVALVVHLIRRARARER